jgi:hypothetical protein
MMNTTTPDDRSRVLSRTLLRAGAILGLGQPELAPVLELDPASVARLYAGEYGFASDSREWERASLLPRLYIGLETMMAGNVVARRAWM